MADNALFVCMNGRQRKAADGNFVVDMKATKDGEPIGKAEEEYTDTFVRKLTKKELAEYLEVERRETEALRDAEKPNAAPTKAKEPKKTTAKAKSKKTAKKMSGLDAAAKVLEEAGEPLRCKQIIETMLAKGYWTTSGQTPWATLYSAILREIQQKGKQARFRKADRGLFTINKAR